MKVPITGGAGYKGVVLAGRLLDRGYDVTVFDNFMYGCESVLHMANHPRLHAIRGDVRHLDGKTVAPYDAVFHLAGISGYPACEANPHSAKLINVDGSKLLGGCLGREQMLIYASTTSFYGHAGAVCDETSPIRPVSLYGMTKHEAEVILMQRENTVALRFATVFGVSPRMRVDLLVNDFVHRGVTERCVVLFDSLSKRTFLHIQDAVDGYVLALDRFAEVRGHVVNVGHESLNFSKRDIAECVQRHTGCKIIDSDIRDLDVRNFVVSFEKARRLGFVPRRTLDDGVAEMVKLFGFYRPFAAYRTI